MNKRIKKCDKSWCHHKENRNSIVWSTINDHKDGTCSYTLYCGCEYVIDNEEEYYDMLQEMTGYDHRKDRK